MDTPPTLHTEDPELPRLCFVGPHLGRHEGWVTTQSEVVAELFRRSGHRVRMTSSVRSPVLRPFAMTRDLRRWRGHYDAVILSIYGGRAFYAADLTSRFAAAPQVHVLHGGLLPELAAAKPSLMRRTLGRADAIVAPSRFLARTAESLGLEAHVIPNVLDLDAAPFRHRESLGSPLEILWVRTFHDIYRPQLGIQALHRLVQRGVPARLTLAGQDKGLEGPCQELAKELGLQERVRFPGFLDAEGKRREFSSHDVYLHTNKVDNMPVTVLEAAAFGLPIVAAAVGGVPDLLESGRTGLLVADGADSEVADAMADALEDLARRPDRASQLSKAGRELAEQSAWPSVHRRWLDLFAAILP